MSVLEVAEWFISREGELFRKDRAARKIEELFDSEYSGYEAIRNLVSDTVDPVEQVNVGGEKYVGVIDFEKHGFWYQYTHYHDIRGKLKRGVCAQCVIESGKDTEVYHATQGMGSVSKDASEGVLEDKIREHLKNHHDKAPEEVQIGAILSAGTTVAGNTVIHGGNDGPGSGVDADLAGGKHSSSFLYTKRLYTKISESIYATPGTEVSQITTASNYTDGLTVDSNNCIWLCESYDDIVVKYDQNGSFISSFTYQSPQGVGIDSNNCIWICESYDDTVKQLDQNGSTTGTSFIAPQSSPDSLAINRAKDDCIWIVDYNNDYKAYKMNHSGSIVSQVSAASDFSLEAAAEDSRGYLWFLDGESDNYDPQGTLTMRTKQGRNIATFAVHASDKGGIHVDSNDSIWTVDSGEVYQWAGVRDTVKYQKV